MVSPDTRNTNEPWAILLAGSHVWRDDSLETVCPRALLPIAEVPLICHTLAWLRAAGIRRVTICSNSAIAAIAECLQDGTAAGVDLFYYEDRLPRGPAGCVADAAAAAADTEQFVVAEGAIIPNFNLRALLATHERTRAAATVVVTNTRSADSPAGECLSPVGVYVLARRALEHIGLTGFHDIKESLLPQLHAAGELVSVYPVAWSFPRLLGLDSYLAAQDWALARLCARQRSCDDYVWRGGAYVHASAHVAGRARIIGPVMIGAETRVESESVIIGPCVIGRAAVVGRQAVVGRSVLWDGCRVGEKVVVDQAVVASGVHVETGELRHVVAAPLRGHDGRTAPRRLGIARLVTAGHTVDRPDFLEKCKGHRA